MRETTTDHCMGEEFFLIYTSEPKYVGKLRKLIEEHPDQVTKTVDDGYTLAAKIPSAWFRFPKPKSRRNMTEEQRLAAANRLQAARSAKNA